MYFPLEIGLGHYPIPDSFLACRVDPQSLWSPDMQSIGLHWQKWFNRKTIIAYCLSILKFYYC